MNIFIWISNDFVQLLDLNVSLVHDDLYSDFVQLLDLI